MNISAETEIPGVPATSRMIDLMEIAAARLMKPRLHDGEASVAVAMNVTFAASNLRRSASGNIRAVAAYQGISGKLHRFTINAFDESGLVGTAEHTRAVVLERRLINLGGNGATAPEVALAV
jgi:fluoroacetyl-CoA thioesterase